MAVSDLDELFRRYYKHSAIRERFREFLGVADLSDAPAAYIVGTNGCSDYSPPTSPDRLPEYLELGWEVDRSLLGSRFVDRRHRSRVSRFRA